MPRTTGSTTARGYGHVHQKERARWQARLQAGETFPCPRCHRPVVNGMAFDLDHRDDRTGYLGPAHRYCNRRAGAIKGNRQRYVNRRTALTW